MTKEEIEKHIQAIKGQENKLYSFLYDLVYEELTNDTKFLEKVYASFLDDQRSEIKRISIYALLFGLKLNNDRYKNLALSEINNPLADFDLKLTCLSSISQAYFGTEDISILKASYGVFLKESEDDDLRFEAFNTVLKTLGLNSASILKKNGKLLISFDDLNLSSFSEELDRLKSLEVI